jgi:hypothetical protein
LTKTTDDSRVSGICGAERENAGTSATGAATE